MRFFRSSLAVMVLGSLFVVACSDDENAAPPSVHTQSTLAPHELPRLVSKLAPNVPHAWPLARTKAGMLRAIGAAAGPDGTSGTNVSEAITAGSRNLVQKTLLLTADASEPSFLSARSSLDRLGVPYDARVVLNNGTPTGLDPATLTDGVSTCFYNSVILTTDALGYSDPVTGAWVSAFSAADWQTLADFETACSAREAIWYAYPQPSLGFSWPTGSVKWDANTVTATVAQPSFFTAVRPSAQVPINYASSYTATSDSTSVPLLTDGHGNTLLALHTYADGRQSVISVFDNSPYLTHSLLFEYDLVKWVTGGMFLGKKRAYLTAQVDDVFIDDDMWLTDLHANDGSVQFRITGSDLSALVTWENKFRGTLPSGSSYSPVFAYNGVGTLKSEYSDTSLLNQAEKLNKSFLWLSHTWDHDSLDGMSQSAAYSEANQNIKVGNNDKLNGFNRTEMVTPDVSGLTTLTALEGIFQAGVRVVVSNTSVAGGGNPSFNVGMANALEPRIYEVPRHPTNFYYDVATPAAETDEYNTYYRSYYGRDLSYAEVLDADTNIGVAYLFTGDADPLMFHQPNLANYNAGTTNPPASLYGDWVAAVAGKFTALSVAPIKTMQQRDIATLMQARAAYNACGVTATIVESSTGRSLQLTSTGSCTVPVTGLSASTAGSVESYLGTTTTSINVSPTSPKTIALP